MILVGEVASNTTEPPCGSPETESNEHCTVDVEEDGNDQCDLTIWRVVSDPGMGDDGKGVKAES